MKIQKLPQLNEREKAERLFLRYAQRWIELGITQERGKPWKDLKYITIFGNLTLKIYQIHESASYAPSLKRQIKSFEVIESYWMALGKPKITIYVTWETSFYNKFNIPFI